MKYPIPFIVLAAIMIGCAANNPVAPPASSPSLEKQNMHSAYDDHYRLWGEFSFFIDAKHERVDVVPRREGRFHLNALKFLEENGKNFLKITGFKTNGDGTFDLSVQIKHPFLGHPEYTGFDVKGIIMFNGSWTHPGYEYYPPWPDPMRVSWRKLGDPQVLNADGYTVRWSPSYDSGSDLPIFKYWPGKWSNETPTANINAYMNYYTDEDRHMFKHWGVIEHTYKLWLPAGQPIDAGYAVEACWEPPTTTPVTDPAIDFPPEANQDEAYEFKLVLENDGYITHTPCCGECYDPTEGYYIKKQWSGNTAKHFEKFTGFFPGKGGAYFDLCGDDYPDYWFCAPLFQVLGLDDGDYIGVAINFRAKINPPSQTQIAYTIFEFTIDI